jgi:hypothetical protein
MVHVHLSMLTKKLLTLFYFRKQVQIHIIDLQNAMACYSKMVHVHLSMPTKKLLTLFYFRKQVHIQIIDL